MTIFCKSTTFFSLALALALAATARAEEKPDKKPAVPAGYEDAGQAAKQPNRQKRPLAIIALPAVPLADNNQNLDNQNLDEDDFFVKNPRLKAMVDQMRRPMQPFFAAELTFAKMVCKPNEEQFQKMKALAAPEYEKALRICAKQQAPRMGIPIQGNRHQQQQPHLFDVFEASVSQIVSTVFPEETAQIYQLEQEHRKNFRARSGAMALVTHLDTQFRFSPAQREKLTDSIQQVWQRGWQNQLRFMGTRPKVFPSIPDESIVPHLNQTQVKQWKDTQRFQMGIHWQHLVSRSFFRKLKPENEWFEKPEKPKKGPGSAAFQLKMQAAMKAARAKAIEDIKKAKKKMEGK